MTSLKMKTAGLMSVLLLAACAPEANREDPARAEDYHIRVLTDTNGCQYITYDFYGGVTPRLDRNGNHICIDVEEVFPE